MTLPAEPKPIQRVSRKSLLIVSLIVVFLSASLLFAYLYVYDVSNRFFLENATHVKT